MPELIDTPSPNPILQRDLACPRCGYNLRGLGEYRCPECGEPFNPQELSETKLPWAHRRRLGRWRAWWQTVQLVVLHPRTLAAQIQYPVSYRDSQQFRRINIFLAWLPLLFATLYNQDGPEKVRWVLPDGGHLGWGITFICHVAALGVLTAITGIPSYFFHPRALSVERQNRAIALSYFTAAPLAFCPWMLLVSWPLVGFGERVQWITLLGLSLVQLLIWWRALVVLAASLGEFQPARVWLTAIAVPICWLVGGVVTWFIITVALMFPALVFYSLQA